MEEIVYKKINETIYKETFDNGLSAYYYPTDKTKNFYITISVKFGGGVTKYKCNNKIIKVIPGSAHFLEHKIMNFTNKKKMTDTMNSLGLYANAYTSNEVTNYNIFGSKDIISAIKLLFDLFYNLDINDKNIEAEKGIIIEELNMYKDSPNFRINMQVLNNVFKNSPIKNILVGEKEDINNINLESLSKIYNDFYRPNNTFIIVSGNYNLNSVSKCINEYMKTIKTINKKINNIKCSEPDEVVTSYMELEESISIPKVIYSFKISKKKLYGKNKLYKRYYLNFIFSSLFSNTSKIYKKYKSKNIFIDMSYSIQCTEKHYIVSLIFITETPDKLLKEFSKDLSKVKIDNNAFIRKKKVFYSNIILNFENIEDVEEMITNNILRANKVLNNLYNDMNNLEYSEMLKVFKTIDFNNHSILKVIPKK